ncbi:MAG: hypothetical protein ISR76_03865 [Planctomycetes bacterium]|nr:hypothetical protein [Planctomycetota bacterium]
MSGAPPPEALPPRRRRRWKVLIGVLAFGMVLVFGPMAAAPLVRARIVEEINRDLDGHLQVGELSLNPFGRIGIAGLRLSGPDGEPLLLAKQAWAETSVLGLIGGNFDGSLLIEGVEIHLWPERGAELRLDPADVGRAHRGAPIGRGRIHFDRMPRVRGTVEVRDSRLVVHDRAGHLSVLDLKLGMVVDGLDQPALVSALLATRDEQGSTGSLKLDGQFVLSDGRHLDADTLQADLELVLERLDLSALAGWFEPDPAWEGLAGLADGRLSLRKPRGQALRLEADLEVDQLRSVEFQTRSLSLAGVLEQAAVSEEPGRDPANVLRLAVTGLETADGLGPLLRYVHPMFAGRSGAADLPGTMDLELELAYPAALAALHDAEAPLAPLRGRGKLSLAPSSLSGSPFLLEMMDAAGAGEQASLGLAPLRFTVAGGSLRYAEPWAVRIGDLETTFHGAVGLDGRLDLEWRLPVTPEVARSRPSAAPRAGELLRVPVLGSLQRPSLDWSSAVGDGSPVRVESTAEGRVD